MKKVYYPDHDQRYAYLPPRERWKYPDEVQVGDTAPIKRVKLFSELTQEDVQHFVGDLPICIAARDVPITEACYDGGSWG